MWKSNKILALQEVGADYLNFNPNWFNDVLQKFLSANKIAYFTTWRNAGRENIDDRLDRELTKTPKPLLSDSTNPVNPQIKPNSENKSFTFRMVKEYYIPFIPDYKYPTAIEDEIKAMENEP